VIRNIGGRITPGLLEQLALLARIGEVAGETPGGGGDFQIIVLSHTDCGITSPATAPCCCTIFKYRQGNSKQKQSRIPVRR
jgi:carbonic anhydrase